MALTAALAALVGCACTQGPFPPSSQFAAKCAAPRTGIDSSTGRPYPDRAGTSGDEKRWIRSWTDELYLWYREVPNLSPDSGGTPIQYFDALKTQATTASGKPKDQFHFTYSTDDWHRLSQSGVRSGYGVQWIVIQPAPPRRVVGAYNEPGSPAALAGVGRGTSVLMVDGEDLVNGSNPDTLNAGLFPATPNESHTFQVQDVNGTVRQVTLVSADVESAPVQNVHAINTGSGLVGYMLFNDHHAQAEQALILGISQLQSAGISDLVLDIRYNGGGFLDIASELGFMIAGPGPTQNQTFEKNQFNDKYPNNDPVTGEPLAIPFHTAALGFSAQSGQPLPHVDLHRLFVLTDSGTCSASESIINSLRGVDIEVIQIGGTTCGKPYGFYPADNCGTTYFAIQFQGVNAKGFGDYADGFVPGGGGPSGVPGCQAADDLSHQLGDPAEARLAAALWYRASGSCPPGAQALESGQSLLVGNGLMVKSPWDENRVYRP
jgi:hypothetical protein